MTVLEWHPITPLAGIEQRLEATLSEIRPLIDSWHAFKVRLRQSSAENLSKFRDELLRSHSIETGILERLYELDRGTTETLIEHGFLEELIPRSSTNVDPALLVEVLRDQEAAIRGLFERVNEVNKLTKGILHELHSVITQHQQTTTGVDQFGSRVEIALLHGECKKIPNNPTRPDGTLHQYCPPLQVEGEIEALLTWYHGYDAVNPIVVAAWLHHRFTEIHPYQDGNGRVARALMNLVLLRADLMPIVIDRDRRIDYLDALEAADGGNLELLVTLFSTLEKASLRQALSVEDDAQSGQPRITDAVVKSLAARVERRKEARNNELRRVNNVAKTLRSCTRKFLESKLSTLKETLEPIGDADVHVADGGPDRNNQHWYKFETVESGRQSGSWVNFLEDHFFSKGTIRFEDDRLVFIVSFHHIGRELSGIMEVTAFAYLESLGDPDEPARAKDRRLIPCSIEPFILTWNTVAGDVEVDFERWLDVSLALASKQWTDQI